jgi:hypothetical protein
VRFQRCYLIPQGQFTLLEPRKLKLIWHTGLCQSLDRYIQVTMLNLQGFEP